MRIATASLAILLMLGGSSPALAQAEMAAWQLAAERLISAMKVNTLQRSTSSQYRSTADVQARTALSSALQAQGAGTRTYEIRSAYGPETGQGYGVCAAKYPMQSWAGAERASTNVAVAFGDADRAWLATGGSAAGRAAELTNSRKTFYCTDEERKALPTWCAQDAGAKRGIPAGDTNAAPFMLRPDIGPEEALTAADYIDTVAPLPTVKTQASTFEERQAQVQARRQGAFLSASRSAFGAVVAGHMGGDGESE